ncbi:recombinase family protein [Streptomyces sp. ALI-76-A]|uniref:recombinase family protein n=1 Tax=Streptomyces sp. ALI-76-A TaxID=3025736 RepID=UPI00256F3725|nr:recombinase family protein [Streptomyces sp. ALI-76-A]MDL5199532.1 recombinase family protein [Streptomyces sp. ALI-76-A]
MPDEGGEHCAVRPGEVWSDAELAAQHRVLVAQREQLGVLGLLRAGEQQEQSEESEEDQVEHALCHGVRLVVIARSCKVPGQMLYVTSGTLQVSSSTPTAFATPPAARFSFGRASGIEDPVAFEEDPGTSSRLHPLQRPKFRQLLTYARPGDTVHISEMFRLVRGTGHILDVLDVLHREQVALRIHDGAFSAMDLTARHPRTGELLSTVKFTVQTLAAASELQDHDQGMFYVRR